MTRRMNFAEFWKNFRLGDELHIAGTFIYNGVRRFHELRMLDNADDLFEVLYNLSVGFERLLKIAVVLCEHSSTTDQNALEQSLITHSHMDLIARVKVHAPVATTGPQNDLLQLLNTFYKTFRYDRFQLSSVFAGEKEGAAIRALLEKHLTINLSNSQFPMGTPNADRYRAFFHRTTLSLAQAIFSIIERQSSALGLYTYELRHGSKAENVFLRKVEIRDEDILWKELLLFFMNSEATSAYFRFLKEIAPLDFDPALIDEYLECFKSDASKASVMDELGELYNQMEPEERKNRLQIMQVIGAPGVEFDTSDESDEDSETASGT